MSSLSLYWHPLSQPARAVLWLCKINGVPVQLHNVNIFAFENRAPDFLKLNPNHQIPVLVDGNFTIYESHSIMRYLCGSRTDAIPDHWYPRNDIRERSKVDQMLDWHHTHLRRGVPVVFFSSILPMFKPNFSVENSPSAKVLFKDAQRILTESLKVMDVLLQKTKFLARDEVSICDLSSATELAQHLAFVNDLDMTPYPHVQRWMKQMQQLPHYDEVHQSMYAFAQQAKDNKQQQQQAKL